MFDVLLEVIAPVLLVATVGGVVGRWLGLSVDTLSNVVFYLFSPALVFAAIAGAQVAADDVGRILVVALGVFAVNVACSAVWSWSRGADPETRAVAVISSAVPNQGNMGLPMAQLAFGTRGLQVAVVIMVIGTVIWSSLGITAGMVAKGSHTRLTALAAPFRYPTLYAALLGLVVNVGDISLPVAIGDAVDTLADASIPCMLVVLGLSFHLPKADHLTEPVAVSVNRLVIGPLAAWPLAAAVGLHGVTASTSIMMAGMPTAVMTTILALQLGLRTELAVRVVIVSTALSVVSLTVLITLCADVVRFRGARRCHARRSTMATTGTRTPARATPTSTGYGAAPGLGANEDVLAGQSTGCAPVGALKVTGAAGSPINPIAIG